MGLRDLIFAATDWRVEKVEVPEWGLSLFVRTLNGKDRERLEGILTSGTDNLRAKVVALVACDENGQRLFTDLEADKLGDKSSSALHLIATAALTLNTIGVSAVDDAKKN